MALYKLLILLATCLTFTLGAIGPGQNAYLPPRQNGYNYNRPSQTFQPQQPSSPAPFRPSVPSTRPPPAFQPPSPRPTYGVPSQPVPQPSQPTNFGLPSPQPPRPFNPPSPRPPQPPAPRPSYGPPQGPPPTGPNYVAQGTGTSGQTIGGGQADHVHVPGMPFDFNYAVKDDQYGNDYSHNAVSDGDVTTGEYRIQLPDGRTQIVKYTADWKTGFHAQVRFEGTPTYPQYQGRPSNQQPVYQPGAPTQGYPSTAGQGYPSGPARPTPAFPSTSRPSQPPQGYPSGPTQGYPSNNRPVTSFPTPRPTVRPNQIPGQQYTPNGGYKY